MKNITQNQAFEQFLTECNNQQVSNTKRINTMMNQNQTKHIDWSKVMCVIIGIILLSVLVYGNVKAAPTRKDTALTVQSQGRVVYVTKSEVNWLKSLNNRQISKTVTTNTNIRNCDQADVIIALILNKRK